MANKTMDAVVVVPCERQFTCCGIIDKMVLVERKHPQRLDNFKSFKSVVEKIPPETARTEDEEGRYL